MEWMWGWVEHVERKTREPHATCVPAMMSVDHDGRVRCYYGTSYASFMPEGVGTATEALEWVRRQGPERPIGADQ